MKNLYISLSFATLALLPAIDGLAQQGSPYTTARAMATSPSRLPQASPSTGAHQKQAADFIRRSNLLSTRPQRLTSADQYDRSRIGVHGLTPVTYGHAAQLPSDEFRGGGYCTAGAEGTIDIALDERIINVTLADIDNASADAAPTAPAYTDFTSVTGNVQAGQVYAITIGVNSSIGTTYDSNQALVWIDFNQDSDFDDAGEQVFVSTIGAVTEYTGNVTIPVSASIGTTRMRIRLHDTHDGSLYENVFNDTPCGVASFGEIEDYSVNISSGGGTPPNDDCTGAVAENLAVGATISFSGDNTGATVDGVTGFVMVWEAFTTTECADVTINYCVAGSEFTNFLINLAVQCPDFITGVLTGANDPCTVTFTDLPAGTYYIRCWWTRRIRRSALTPSK